MKEEKEKKPPLILAIKSEASTVVLRNCINPPVVLSSFTVRAWVVWPTVQGVTMGCISRSVSYPCSQLLRSEEECVCVCVLTKGNLADTFRRGILANSYSYIQE